MSDTLDLSLKIRLCCHRNITEWSKEVLGLWISGYENAKYWLGVLNEIKNGGKEDITILSIDCLAGFVDAIGDIFPKAKIQRCIVHQVRLSTKFVNYKDLKPFVKDLKQVYQAPTGKEEFASLDEFETVWGKFPSIIASLKNNWPPLSAYFKYPQKIRKIIYTTNSIENFNRQLRKVTKSRTIFPTDDALFKILYLVAMDIAEKWTGAS